MLSCQWPPAGHGPGGCGWTRRAGQGPGGAAEPPRLCKAAVTVTVYRLGTVTAASFYLLDVEAAPAILIVASDASHQGHMIQHPLYCKSAPLQAGNFTALNHCFPCFNQHCPFLSPPQSLSRQDRARMCPLDPFHFIQQLIIYIVSN